MRKTIYLLCLIAFLTIQTLTAQTGTVFFNDAVLHEIRFDKVDTTSFFTYGNKGVNSMVKISIDGTVIDSIAATTKGNISWNHINNKKPLKIDLSKYNSAKNFDGIKKFYLHNNYEDPSLMREKITYDICKQMGLHALRTAFAKVYINNVYWGLYTLVEGKDDLYVRDFNNKSAEVYETLDFGSPCIFSQDPSYWIIDNGKPQSSWPRLAKMTSVLSSTPLSQYVDTASRYFNLIDFIKYQAVNVYLLNFDSYLQYNGNQLYLFDSVKENRFQIIPWDFNASFGLWNTAAENPKTLNILPSIITSKCPFDKVIAIPSLRDTYVEALCTLNTIYCDTNKLNAKINLLYSLVRSAAYSDLRKMPTNSEFDLGTSYGYQSFASGNVPGLKTFVNERWEKVNSDLVAISKKCNTTRIENTTVNEAESISLYPNPAHEFIKITGAKPESTISILNASGQNMFTEKCHSSNTFQIKISNWSAGLYLFVLKDCTGNTTKIKFLKSE